MNYKRNPFSRSLRRLLFPVVFVSLVLGWPALAGLDPAPQENQRPWAIHGFIVSDEGAREGWLLFDRSGISCVQCPDHRIPQDAQVIKYDGYIFPGLIDNHNHAQWNALPKWRAPASKTYKSRYEWLIDKNYLKDVNKVFFDGIGNTHLDYASIKYAEVRAIIGGTTMIQSTYSNPQPELLVRNLDATYGADSRIQDITGISEEEIYRFRTGLASGKLRRIFLHVAEGFDDKCMREFAELKSRGLARPGVVVIHGIGLSRQDFQAMFRAGMFLVWSPKSNDVLYKRTAKVRDALEEGVTVALSPDWTITGSNNMLEELKVAHDYSQKELGGRITDFQLFQMATSNAAKVAGVDERLGRIAFGYAADLFLAPKLDPNPFVSLIKTNPRDIHLVFIDGSPLYGDADELRKWIPGDSLDPIPLENSNKAILLRGDPRAAWHSQQRYADVLQILRNALPKVAPLIEP